MAAIVARNVPLMNDEQESIYGRIMLADSAGQGGFFYLDVKGLHTLFVVAVRK